MCQGFLWQVPYIPYSTPCRSQCARSRFVQAQTRSHTGDTAAPWALHLLRSSRTRHPRGDSPRIRPSAHRIEELGLLNAAEGLSGVGTSSQRVGFADDREPHRELIRWRLIDRPAHYGSSSRPSGHVLRINFSIRRSRSSRTTTF